MESKIKVNSKNDIEIMEMRKKKDQEMTQNEKNKIRIIDEEI